MAKVICSAHRDASSFDTRPIGRELIVSCVQSFRCLRKGKGRACSLHRLPVHCTLVMRDIGPKTEPGRTVTLSVALCTMVGAIRSKFASVAARIPGMVIGRRRRSSCPHTENTPEHNAQLHVGIWFNFGRSLAGSSSHGRRSSRRACRSTLDCLDSLAGRRRGAAYRDRRRRLVK